MQTRFELWKQEQECLKGIYERTPELLTPKQFVEGPEFLQQFGIEIPKQETFPYGYIKLWPQDFVVEEIPERGAIQTVNTSHHIASTTQQKGSTVYATLVKCNISTFQAIEELAQLLKADSSKLTYAGLKDHDAFTSQRISMCQVSLEAVQQIRSDHFFLKDISKGKGYIGIGRLQGNRFTILVRLLEAIDFGNFEKQVKQIEQTGFYNYFYLQRFGEPRYINVKLGLDILKGEYEQAVRDVCTSVSPGQTEFAFFAHIRKSADESWGDWKTMYDLLSPCPIYFQSELKMLDYLIQHPDDFVGALRLVSEYVMMWINAVSSLLFNKKLSTYLRDKRTPPKELPLFFSLDPTDWAYYQTDMEELGILSPKFENLQPFENLKPKTRFVITKQRVVIHKIKSVEAGVIIQFSLPKGAYATTFLSHIFQLYYGAPPVGISDTQIDIKSVIGDDPMSGELDYFKSVIRKRQSFDVF